MWLAFGLFVFALIGIGGLFTLKRMELVRGGFWWPGLRAKADMRAREFKGLLFAAREDLEKIPPLLVRLFHVLLHRVALMLAALLGSLQAQAHRLADLVSHRRHFSRRETRSEFLRKVAERRNGENDTLNV